MLHIRKIKPLFTSIVTTGDKFEKDMVSNGIIVARQGDLKVWQKVIATGPSVRDIKVGDMVMINIDHFAIRKYNKNSVQNDLDNNPVVSWHFNWVTLEEKDGEPQECLLMEDRDIQYVFEGEEKDDIVITPGTPKLIIT